MNTDARRKASANYHAKRTAEGAKKVTVWLGAEELALLETLKADYGSKDAAVCAAIRQAIPPSKHPMANRAKIDISNTPPVKLPETIWTPAPALSVPFGGDVVRKPMQKGSKK